MSARTSIIAGTLAMAALWGGAWAFQATDGTWGDLAILAFACAFVAATVAIGDGLAGE